MRLRRNHRQRRELDVSVSRESRHKGPKVRVCREDADVSAKTDSAFGGRALRSLIEDSIFGNTLERATAANLRGYMVL